MCECLAEAVQQRLIDLDAEVGGVGRVEENIPLRRRLTLEIEVNRIAESKREFVLKSRLENSRGNRHR